MNKNGTLSLTRFAENAPAWLKQVLNLAPEDESSSAATRSIISIIKPAEGLPVEHVLFAGEVHDWEAKVVSLMSGSEYIMVQGFPLEHLAALCFQHKYRWSFDHSHKKQVRFILTPCATATQAKA